MYQRENNFLLKKSDSPLRVLIASVVFSIKIYVFDFKTIIHFGASELEDTKFHKQAVSRPRRDGA